MEVYIEREAQKPRRVNGVLKETRGVNMVRVRNMRDLHGKLRNRDHRQRKE